MCALATSRKIRVAGTTGGGREGRWINLSLVVLGGGIGAGGRYLLGGWLYLHLGNGFPWGTFAVNALGSLMIELVFGLAQSKAISPGTTLFLAVGVLGGFTTFSAFSYETMRLLANGSISASFLNVAGQFAVGLLAVYAGFVAVRVLG